MNRILFQIFSLFHSINYLHHLINPHLPQYIKLQIQKQAHVKLRIHITPNNHSISLLRICTPMRSNIYMRGNSNLQHNILNPNYRKQNSILIMGKLLSIPTHIKTIHNTSLYFTSINHSNIYIAHNYPSRKRILI